MGENKSSMSYFFIGIEVFCYFFVEIGGKLFDFGIYIVV